jgi:hypothetical protein
MANLTNQLGYVTNPQFSGGEPVTPLSGSEFAWQNKGYGGLYVGTPGTLVVKTLNGDVLTFVSASGFIPGLIGAVSASSTAANIIGFDPIPVALPTTTTSTSTTAAPTTTTSTSTTSTSTTAAPSTSTTTAAGPTLYSFSVGIASGSVGIPACNNAKAGTVQTIYADAASLAVGVIAYTDAGGTLPISDGVNFTLGAGNPKWGVVSGGPPHVPGRIEINYGTCS